MQEHLTKLLETIAAMEGDLQSRAEQLCQLFTEERTRRRDEEVLKEQEAGRSGRNLYAPLVLHQRIHKGTLELTWTELHKPKTRSGKPGGNRYLYIKKGQGGGYGLRDLMSRARYFETQLVTETEEKARELRQEWKDLVEIRRVARRFVQRQAARKAATAET